MAGVLAERSDDVDALRRRCESAAEQLVDGAFEDVVALEAEVTRLVRLDLADDIAAVMALDRDAKQRFADGLFSDRATWAGALGFIYGAATGVDLAIGGGVLAALAAFGSHVFKATRERQQELNAHPLRLLYRLRSGGT